jgi:hypothetical protein
VSYDDATSVLFHTGDTQEFLQEYEEGKKFWGGRKILLYPLVGLPFDTNQLCDSGIHWRRFFLLLESAGGTHYHAIGSG